MCVWRVWDGIFSIEYMYVGKLQLNLTLNFFTLFHNFPIEHFEFEKKIICVDIILVQN